MGKRRLTKNTYRKYCLIIDEWFINKFNGAAAYRKYFPNVKNNNTATVNFSKIQALPEIQAYIHEKHEEAARIYEVTHEGTLRRLKAYLESDLTESLGMTIEQVKNLPIEIRQWVDGHKRKTRSVYDKDGKEIAKIEEFELRFSSKERMQEMVNKHIGFYEKDNDQKKPSIDFSGFTYEQLAKLAGYD